MRQLLGWSEQNHFCPQSSIEFKTKYLAFVLWITLQFYLILVLVSEPEASKIALQVFLCSRNVIQGSPNFGWRLWVFFQAQKSFFWILKKCGTNCTLSHWEGRLEACDPPPEPELNGVQVVWGLRDLPQVFWLHLWPRTTLGGEQRAVFSEVPGHWPGKGDVYQVDLEGAPAVGGGRARHQGGGNWIPNTSTSRAPKVRLLFSPRNVLLTP